MNRALERFAVAHLSVPVKLVSASLSCLIRNEVNELLASAASPGRRVYKQIVEVKVRSGACCRRVWVVGCKANGLRIITVGRNGSADGVLSVQEALKGDFCDVGGDGALVKDVILLPEVLPCFFVGGLDGADLDG